MTGAPCDETVEGEMAPEMALQKRDVSRIAGPCLCALLRPRRNPCALRVQGFLASGAGREPYWPYFGNWSKGVLPSSDGPLADTKGQKLRKGRSAVSRSMEASSGVRIQTCDTSPAGSRV